MHNELNTVSLPSETKEQLGIIDQSLDYLFMIIVAVVLSYYGVTVQRKQLICDVLPNKTCCLPDLFPIRLTSSILIIIALSYFFKLSEKTNMTSCADFAINRSNIINCIASFLVLLAAILRFVDLVDMEIRIRKK